MINTTKHSLAKRQKTHKETTRFQLSRNRSVNEKESNAFEWKIEEFFFVFA